MIRSIAAAFALLAFGTSMAVADVPREITWDNLSGIPAGFDDGVDDDTDTSAATLCSGAAYLAGAISLEQLAILIGSNYLFKMAVALLDTGPFYLGVYLLRRYLQVEHPDTVDHTEPLVAQA